MKILVTAARNGIVAETFFTERARQALSELGEVCYNPFDRELTREELRDALEGMDVVISSWYTEHFDDFVLSKADTLKVAASTGGSASGIAADKLVKRGVPLLTGNAIYAHSVAEGCIGYMLWGQREFSKYESMIQKSGWREETFYNRGLAHKKIGIVGFGFVAKFLVEMLRPFRPEKIMVYSSHLSKEEEKRYGVQPATLQEIFSQCDIVSLHASLNEKNYHMITGELVKSMKDDALLVNTARGAVIDEAAMAEELKTGRIRAVLDVFEEEPLPLDSPLRNLENVYLIPHMAGPTIDRRESVTLALARDIARFFRGESDLETQIPPDYAKQMTNSSYLKKNG